MECLKRIFGKSVNACILFLYVIVYFTFFYIRQPHKFIRLTGTSEEERRGSDSNALPPGHEPTSYQLLYPALEVRLDYEKA